MHEPEPRERSTNTPDPDALARLFQAGLSAPIRELSPLLSHASARRRLRLRLADGQTLIGVYNPHGAENRAFVSFTRTFRELELPVPRVHYFDAAHNVYIEDDLGDSTLFDVLKRMRRGQQDFPPALLAHYRHALERLVSFQVQAAPHVDYSLCYQGREFDRTAMVHDMLFFLDEFVERQHIDYDRAAVAEAFGNLAAYLCDQRGAHFMYRDFQSRNIMVIGDALYFIDYQSGRRGPLQYDVVSLLYQSQARIPEEAREELLGYYLAALSRLLPVDRTRFRALFDGFVFLRLMQVLGTYGKLGLGSRKGYFLRGIPVALATLQQQLERGSFPLQSPPLMRLFERLLTEQSVGDRA